MVEGSTIAWGVLCSLGILAVTVWLVRIYARPGTPLIVSVTTGVSWFMSFMIVLLLPIDMTYHADRDSLNGLWNTIYWAGYIIGWVLIPVLQGYYDAGDFDTKSRIKSSLRSNLIFMAVAGTLFVAFLIYVAVQKEFGWSQLLGFAIALGNTWGLVFAIFMLGYGLVEVPRTLWHAGNRVVHLKLVHFRITTVFEHFETTKEDVYQTQRLIDNIRPRVGMSSPLRKHFEIVSAMCPRDLEMGDLSDHDRSGHIDKLPIVEQLENKEPSLESLVKLHTHTKALARRLWLVESQWRELVERAEVLEDLIGFQKTPLSGPRWNEGFRKAFAWRWRVFWEPRAMRAAAVFCIILSCIMVWSEATMLSPVDLSPISNMIDSVRPNSGGVQILSILILGYLSLCSFWSLFKLRVSNFYEMHYNKRTDENSLLFNGSYLLRLVFPLGYNFCGLAKAKGTSFQTLVGQMQVIPFLGSSFNDVIPILISLLVLATLFNVYGRFLKCMQVSNFEYTENFDDHAISEGQFLLRKEKRKRESRFEGSSSSPTSLTAMERGTSMSNLRAGSLNSGGGGSSKSASGIGRGGGQSLL